MTVDAAAFKAFEVAGWEHQAPTYDDFFGRITQRFVDPLLDAAGVGRGARVLDVATGPGYAAARAAERGASVIGVDAAPAMVRPARQRHPGIDFRRADIEALPFEDGCFDAAVGNFVVPHLGCHEEAVRELVRVLGDGGTLALTTWDMPDRMRLLAVFLDAFAAAGATPPEDLPAGPPFFRFAVDEEFKGLRLRPPRHPPGRRRLRRDRRRPRHSRRHRCRPARPELLEPPRPHPPRRPRRVPPARSLLLVGPRPPPDPHRAPLPTRPGAARSLTRSVPPGEV